ncbi:MULTISPECIES: succinate dehydrogenase cytochrome b subunit [Micromonospora]|uniref:Succinate dehydrogenase n=1 Tax=Micromonospora solifontis TaxID=2487138 RepID=A0ABX9WJC8_9ACTN|nr:MULTISPECIES: succinate dehydrogenase cytochrome b subunit [Micromonospora]NES15413.1 succinate dehydrogenase cytochrome b subunit [Micromonospora sp. PPF5-17B]NES35841.1 succinate dehydrogenase cytochrome b subunit [Micromonospora solifontis]NES58007.1 succinate dehydrogenase cytochrome b subunit [Micromonospora sp. PPF5-6]RNM00317.1 succinate dehydrogenase [Micromonospora solifontis]
MHWTTDQSALSVGRVVLTKTRSPIRSNVGLKAVMAVTGIILVLFLIAHMLGNLKIFTGEEAFNHYAHWLRDLGTPLLAPGWYLWLQRTVLMVAVLAHIGAATVLALRARAARPVAYAHRRKIHVNYAARTMRWGGVIILLFVIYHILDLTTGTLNPVGDSTRPHSNVVADFAPERWYVTLFYTLAVVTLGFHLRHGAFSAFRSLGQQTPKGERRARTAALVFAVVLTAGYLVVPFAVLTGLVA